MSLLTQFYPSSSGGAGSGIQGYVAGFPYGDSGVYNVSGASLNGATGIYYLSSQFYIYDQTYGQQFAYTIAYSSRDGENWDLGFVGQGGGNQSISYLNLITPGAGGANDATMMGLQTGSGGGGGYNDTIYATSNGAGAAGQAGFQTINNFGTGLRDMRGGYYQAGNRYYVVGYDNTDSIYCYTSTDAKSWSGAALGLVGYAFTSRGRTEGYLMGSDQVLQRTTNGGLTWTATGVAKPAGSYNIAAGAEGTGNLIADGYYTTNNGATWPAMSLPAGVTNITSLAYSDKADRYIAWAGGSNNYANFGKMLVSTDGTGSTWTVAAASDPALAAQLWGRTLGTNAGIGLGTDLYYMAPAAFFSNSVDNQSSAVISKIDVSLL